MTKYSEMVLDPMRIRFCLEKSLYLAQTGRPGPCWLDIPLNVQGLTLRRKRFSDLIRTITKQAEPAGPVTEPDVPDVRSA